MLPSLNVDVRLSEIVFESVLDRLELNGMWRYIQENNPSGNAPYHSNQHMFHVARIANDLLLNGGYSDPLLQRCLITAALWHDYGHTAGVSSDPVNIAIALSGFQQWKETYTAGWVPSETCYRSIVRLIQGTEFPYTSDVDSVLLGYLRDADLLYSISEDRVLEVMEGLRSEMSHKGTIDLVTMGERQIAFLSNTTLNSPLGKRIWDELYPKALEAQQRYVSNHKSTKSEQLCQAM